MWVCVSLCFFIVLLCQFFYVHSRAKEVWPLSTVTEIMVLELLCNEVKSSQSCCMMCLFIKINEELSCYWHIELMVSYLKYMYLQSWQRLVVTAIETRKNALANCNWYKELEQSSIQLWLQRRWFGSKTDSKYNKLLSTILSGSVTAPVLLLQLLSGSVTAPVYKLASATAKLMTY